MQWSDLDEPAAFSRYMEAVDDRLRIEGVAIPWRPLHSMGLISKELRISFSWRSDVFRRIEGWWTHRYGPRLLVDWSPGSMLIEVHGDAYEVKYPRLYGTHKIDIAQLIQRITPETLATLSPAEVAALTKLVIDGLRAFQTMENMPAAFHADLPNAVLQMLERSGDPGLSRWSSQQAVEKSLNGYVEAKGHKPKRSSHDLLPLVEQAEKLGLSTLDRQAIAEVQCSVDARYPGRLATTPSDAVRANQAAVMICGAIAAQWGQ